VAYACLAILPSADSIRCVPSVDDSAYQETVQGELDAGTEHKVLWSGALLSALPEVSSRAFIAVTRHAWCRSASLIAPAPLFVRYSQLPASACYTHSIDVCFTTVGRFHFVAQCWTRPSEADKQLQAPARSSHSLTNPASHSIVPSPFARSLISSTTSKVDAPVGLSQLICACSWSLTTDSRLCVRSLDALLCTRLRRTRPVTLLAPHLALQKLSSLN